MCRIYNYHYRRIMEAIPRIKCNEYPRPIENVPTPMQTRKRFNALKFFYAGDRVMINPKCMNIDKIKGIVPNKEYTIQSIVCSRNNVSISLTESDIKVRTETKDNFTTHTYYENSYDPRIFLLIDPVARIPTKVTLEKDESGELVRVSELSGTIIPIPHGKHLDKKLYNAFMYTTGLHDTPPNVALISTYKKSLYFPHEEIMKALNIKTSYDWGKCDIRYLIQLEKENSK